MSGFQTALVSIQPKEWSCLKASEPTKYSLIDLDVEKLQTHKQKVVGTLKRILFLLGNPVFFFLLFKQNLK